MKTRMQMDTACRSPLINLAMIARDPDRDSQQLPIAWKCSLITLVLQVGPGGWCPCSLLLVTESTAAGKTIKSSSAKGKIPARQTEEYTKIEKFDKIARRLQRQNAC